MSTLKANKMLLKDCVRYLASVADVTKKVVTEFTDFQVVYRFPDVFPEE